MSEAYKTYPFLKVLEPFTRIDLYDIPEEALMERIDRKFVCHVEHIAEILEGLDPYYRIVEAANTILSPYNSLYFDTADFHFFRRHHSGFTNRSKVRYRAYPKTNTTFLELKQKNNKGITHKTRILKNGFDFPFDGDSTDFIKNGIKNVSPDQLRPSVRIDYIRLAFISFDNKERFSVDFNISAEFEDKSAQFGKVAIIEVKQTSPFSSPIISRLRACCIRESKLSKYCTALAMLNPQLKANGFKSDLRRISKINHQYVENAF